jgi:hypothetical protein
MKYLLLFVLLITSGCSSVSVGNNPITRINRLHKPVYLADIKKLYAPLNHGHSSFMSVELKGDTQEMWFWFLPSEDAKSDSFSGNPDQFEVPFITIGNVDDPDSQQVVWPKKYVGQSLKNDYSDVYKDLLDVKK